jgi:hypothetical protein
MLEPILTAISLSGFILAHAMQLLSTDTAGHGLLPVAFVASGSDQKFMTFEGSSLEQMVANAESELASKSYDAWVLSYEGYVVTRNHRQRAILVRSWTRGLTAPLVIAQPLVQDGDKLDFGFLGKPIWVQGSNAPPSENHGRVEGAYVDDSDFRVLMAGMDKYRKFQPSKGLDPP